MNSQLIQQGRAAYRAGDIPLRPDARCGKTPSEIWVRPTSARQRLDASGHVCRGAEAYAAALNDGTYGKRGALLTNRGKALAAVGDYVTAAQAFSAATQDASYATPFKAYLAWATPCSSRATMPTREPPSVRPPSTAPIRLLPPHSASSVVASLSSAVRRTP